MNIQMDLDLEVSSHIEKRWGNITSLKKLDGIKSEGGCYRAKHKSGSVIVKSMEVQSEYQFYKIFSKKLIDNGVNIPEIYFAHQGKEKYWIVIEDIPNTLPKDRWYGDESLLEVLCNLHYFTWGRPLILTDNYKPSWSDCLSEKVSELYKSDDNKALKHLLRVQKVSQTIFQPTCWINGDTNPTNWGVRDNGDLVLFDWERICYASPAIDLAITIPGLGTTDYSLERKIAETYIKLFAKKDLDFLFKIDELVEQIILAKIWSAVEFLAYNHKLLEQNQLETLLTELLTKLKKF